MFFDNFDFLIKGFNWPYESEARKTYESLGTIMNNENSQKAHFDQATSIQPYLRSDAILIFDDTWKTGNGYDGKGGSAVPWLQSKNYTILDQGVQGDNVIGGFISLQRKASKVRDFSVLYE